MLYRITIKRGAATITTLTLQTDDPQQAIRMARLDFDLHRRAQQCNGGDPDGPRRKGRYTHPQSDNT
jgi:hypothetical protein